MAVRNYGTRQLIAQDKDMIFYGHIHVGNIVVKLIFASILMKSLRQGT